MKEKEEYQDVNKVIKLINGDLIIGPASKSESAPDTIIVQKPYTVKDLGKGPCVLPYEMYNLMEPMKFISFQAFNILWLKNLSDFPEVEKQYVAATSGLDL